MYLLIQTCGDNMDEELAKSVIVQVSPEMHAEFKQSCIKAEVTMSDVVRSFIEEINEDPTKIGDLVNDANMQELERRQAGKQVQSVTEWAQSD